MKSALALLAVGLLGLFGATSIGYAAYVVSRDSVGLPVTKLKLSPNDLAPTLQRKQPGSRGQNRDDGHDSDDDASDDHGRRR